jgi:hypothetical protein
MPKGSFLFGRARAEARVLTPIETTGLTMTDIPQLKDQVRQMISKTRDELFGELGITPKQPDVAPAR